MINRIYDYEQKIKSAVADTVDTIKKGDVCGQISYSQSVNFEHDKLQSIDDVSHSAIFCRLFEKGRVGNAAVNNPELVSDMIKNAEESALFGEALDFDLPPAKPYQDLKWLYSPKNINYSKKDLKDISEDLLSKIKAFAPDAKVSVGAANSASVSFLQNTEGFKGVQEFSTLSVYGGVFELGEDGSFLELYEGDRFFDNEYTPDKILKDIQSNLERSKIISTLPKEGAMPVIFAPEAVDMILTPVEIALNGNTLYKDLSLFAGRAGEKLFDEKFNFSSDPHYYLGSSSCAFDDEGTVTEKQNLISNGIFNNFIYDCATAKKMNAHSTGNAGRGVVSLPKPMLSNRIVGAGSHTLDEMIASIDCGLMLLSSIGEGQSNVIAGDFSVLGYTVYLIENGVLKGRVKDIMLSGNGLELLKNIPMIENIQHRNGSLITPHIMLDGVMVSKK